MPPKPKRSSTPKTKIKINTPRTSPTPRTTNKTTTTSPKTKRKAIRHHACRLIPPCKQGHGGPAKTILPIGKYFFSEEALEHDLGALKRGAIYPNESEFYKRVKAWYKAEVDRLLHRQRFESERKKGKEEKELDKIMTRPTAMTRPGATRRKLAATSDSNDMDLSDDRSTSDSADSPSDSEYSDFQNKHPRKSRASRANTPSRKNPEIFQTPSPSPDKPTPTRVQPTRAAKRKKAETPSLPPTPPKTPSLKRRKVTLIIKRPNQEPKAEQLEKNPAEQPENNAEETKCDYSLSKLDFDESQPSYADRGEMADGLDVAHFMIGLEKAVEGAINELVAARLGNGVLSLCSPRESNGGVRARWRRFGSISHVGGQGRIVQESKNEEEGEVFEPAGDAVPGEDWRPPQPPRSARPESGKGVKMQKGLELRIASREGTPAPEAVMEPSPTLGRWQLADRRASGSSGLGGYERVKAGDMVKMKLEVDSEAVAAEKESAPALRGKSAVVESPIEESNKKSVQVSGLKFDVELRTLEVGQDGEGRKDIWFHML
ncbi:hypothetical protein N0V85_001908 [Neurospora sp. IMI 360204]|nr:hypothetical protein N0V85_001908 [Neurospora sp. IMI 360204]